MHIFSTTSTKRPAFPTSLVVIYLMFSEVSWEVVVRVVDIGGIDDHHHCLNFHFIKRKIPCIN
jgi:hypothetical protein